MQAYVLDPISPYFLSVLQGRITTQMKKLNQRTSMAHSVSGGACQLAPLFSSPLTSEGSMQGPRRPFAMEMTMNWTKSHSHCGRAPLVHCPQVSETWLAWNQCHRAEWLPGVLLPVFLSSSFLGSW